MTAPQVSVVIAARNAEATIEACLASLSQQTLTDHEVIVVDDGSTDRTAALASAAGATVVSVPGVGASAARNIGLRHAAGRVVAFTDADCTVPPHWLGALITVLDRTGATGVGGSQRNVFPADLPGAAAFDAFFRLASVVSDYTRSGGGVREVTHNASCNSAYRTDALTDIGGFTDGLWPGEDVDLDIRLRARGATLLFVPDAVVSHHRPGTMAWFRRMMRRYGAAERALVRLHGRARRIDYLPPLLLTIAAVHLLYLVPACRPWLAIADIVAVSAAALALVVTTPPQHWTTVIGFAVTAVWAWHLGWYAGTGADR